MNTLKRFRKIFDKDCLEEAEADVSFEQEPPLLEVMLACLWTDNTLTKSKSDSNASYTLLYSLLVDR